MNGKEAQEMVEDWKAAWQPMIDAVGRDFGNGNVTYGADEVTAATIRRYLEPLEFDCPLHYDGDVAREYGYTDVVAPATSIGTFSLPPMWQPGETIFTSHERNAQPTSKATTGLLTGLEPPTTGYFATNYEVEYFRPVVAGDRLHRRGAKLIDCTPKETRVGRGAFLNWEGEICNQRGEVVARTRTSFFRYNPHGGEQ